MNTIRVMVVDDHPLVRQGVRSLLSNYDDLEIVAEADNGTAALRSVADLMPNVILLDIRMPGESGIDLVKRLQQTAPDSKVLMLTSFDDREYVTGALRAGAHGYVLKSISDETLVNTIRAVYYGERVLSPQVLDQMIRYWTTGTPEPEIVDLTEDERGIMRLLVNGASNSKIASDLYMSETTVKRKLQEVFEKLSVHSRTQAAAEAVRLHLI
jgi:two-component system response regulator DevR